MTPRPITWAAHESEGQVRVVFYNNWLDDPPKLLTPEQAMRLATDLMNAAWLAKRGS